MSPPRAAVARHWGAHVYTSAHVTTRPLGYERATVPVGSPLPIPRDDEMLRSLERCAQVVVAFDGKMGDSLLAFGAVSAVTDALSLLGRSVPLVSVGRYGGVYPNTHIVAPRSARFIVGDEPGVALADPTGDDYVLICRPEQAHCVDDGHRAHTALPARYYLGVEGRFGRRLPGNPPFLSCLGRSTDAPVYEDLTMAAVTATSWPERKGYPAQGFATAASIIGQRLGRTVRLLLVSGREGEGPLPMNTRGLRVDSVRGAGLQPLISLFARCDVVLGTDTGLTHLAALSSCRAEVIGLYGRHSHSKWRTGLAHHHALATPFSERMHLKDLCPVRDGLDETEEEGYLPVSQISPHALADTTVLSLELAYL